MACVCLAPSASAEQPVDSGIAPVCGFLSTFNGNVQVFDADRSVIRDVGLGMKIHCGDWVSVESGNAHIEQVQSGAKVMLTAGTFAQVVNAGSTIGSIREHLVLYRGEIYAKQHSREEFRVITPQARVTFSASEGYVLAQDTLGETQVLTVEGKNRIQNRFIDHAPIIVSEGKFSKVGTSTSRNIPHEARYGEPEMMQERLTKFGVAPKTIATLVQTARKNARPSLPAKLRGAQRSLASVSSGKADTEFRADQTGGAGEPKEPETTTPIKPVKKVESNAKKWRKPASVQASMNLPTRRVVDEKKEKDQLLKRLSVITEE